MFDNFFNMIFGFIIDWSPLYGLIIIAFILTFLITLAYKYLTDQKLMKSTKIELKELQKQMKELRNNPEKMMQVQKEAMEKNMKLMTSSFRPMLFTFIPLILVFGWLRNTYNPIGSIIFGLGWLWVYIISSVIFSLILRKLLKVH